MLVLIAGAGGLVGTSTAEHCRELGDNVVAFTHDTMDITNAELVDKVIAEHRPDITINCAAWTDVDACESNPERAFLVNAQGVQNLAVACSRVKAAFVTISTDYVFDGTKKGFYTQRDTPNPQSVYALSKLEGERKALTTYNRTIVVRTGFVFGPAGKNFLSTVISRARQGDRLRAISDVRGTPTFAPDLAARLRELALLDVPKVFHVVNSGTGASYEEFTKLALAKAGLNGDNIEAVSMASLKRPAARPVNSRLRCLVSGPLGLAPLPAWQGALSRFIGQQRQNGRPVLAPA